MRSMTLAHIAHLLKAPLPSSPLAVQGYGIDTRLLMPGEIFFALKGERVDGHDYLLEVKQRGALAAVVSKRYPGTIEGLDLIRVEDPLVALQDLSKATLLSTPVRIVAITGSIGKTTTKEFVRILLTAKYRVAASPGNSNSQVGIPLTILNHTQGDEEILILEMGMTSPGHLARLVQIAPPEVAVLNTVALVHACNFDSLEEIALAKAEIFSHSHTCMGILNGDMPYYSQISQIGTCIKQSFSWQSSQADYAWDPSDVNLLHARLEGKLIKFPSLPVPGKHNRYNLMPAIAVARHFQIEWEDILKQLPLLILPERRLQFIRRKNILFLNDSYNASELSVKSALETLPEPEEGGRKIAVLGSMMELGKFSAECHQRVGEFALHYVEKIYCLGEECLPLYEIWKNAGRAIQMFNSRDDLVASLREELRPSDVVLLKGSRSKELWKVLEEI